MAAERSEEKRAAFLEATRDIDPSRLVFLDECGFGLNLHRLYGWCAKNKRCREAVPFNRGTNRSVVGAVCVATGMVAFSQKLQSYKRDDIEAFLKEVLLPRLAEGSVLVMDNARIHHHGKIAEIVAAAKCSLLYLPPYSPDFSPMELAWGWIKQRVRRQKPRDDEARQSAVVEAMNALPTKFMPGWFAKCGHTQY